MAIVALHWNCCIADWPTQQNVMSLNVVGPPAISLFSRPYRTSKSIAATGTDFAEPSDHDGQSLTPMYDNLMPLYNSDMPGMLTLVVGLD